MPRNYKLCRQCRTGTVPGEEKTFLPSCPGCQEKRAKGTRTGKEPRPKFVMGFLRRRLPRDEFSAFVARQELVKSAKRALHATLPGGRVY